MKKFLFLVFVICTMFLLVGCGDASEGDINQDGGYSTGEQVGNNVVVDTNRKVYYVVEYSITGDIRENKNKISLKVNEIGGYVSSSNEYNTSATIVYKVPTDKLNSFLDFVDAFDGVGKKSVSSTDITSSYAYTEAKLKTLQASREAYVKLLSDTNLSMQQIMSINDKIAEIDVELLKIANEKAMYDNKIEYSTVTVKLTATPTEEKEPGFFTEYFEYLGNFFVGLGKVILYLLPFALVGGVIFSAIYFPVKIKKNKRLKK